MIDRLIGLACLILWAAAALTIVALIRRLEMRLELHRIADLWAQGEEPDPDWHPSTAPLTGDIAAWEAELRREDHSE